MLTTLFSTVLAGTTFDLVPTTGFGNTASAFTLPAIVQALITLVLIIAAIVFFFMLIWGGIGWIMSGGDKSKTEAARNRITAALVGLIILFSAWAITQLLSSFLGFNILGLLDVPTITP